MRRPERPNGRSPRHRHDRRRHLARHPRRGRRGEPNVRPVSAAGSCLLRARRTPRTATSSFHVFRRLKRAAPCTGCAYDRGATWRNYSITVRLAQAHQHRRDGPRQRQRRSAIRLMAGPGPPRVVGREDRPPRGNPGPGSRLEARAIRRRRSEVNRCGVGDQGATRDRRHCKQPYETVRAARSLDPREE
jgi:hypothetical protein